MVIIVSILKSYCRGKSMELIIKNTHIFDNKIKEEFSKFIKSSKCNLDVEKCYVLVIT